MTTSEPERGAASFDEDGEAAGPGGLYGASGRGRDLSFLASDGELVDWRLVLAYEAAAETGVLEALPGSLGDLAERCGLDEGALRARYVRQLNESEDALAALEAERTKLRADEATLEQRIQAQIEALGKQ